MWRDRSVGWGRVVVVVDDEIGRMEGSVCGREFDRVDVEDGGGGMKVGKMGFEGTMRGWIRKLKRWTADGMACEGIESNIAAEPRGRGIGRVGVLEALDMVVDGIEGFVVAVVDAVVVAVASG